MLCLVLSSSGQERHGASGASTLKDDKDDEGAGAFSYEDSLRELSNMKR